MYFNKEFWEVRKENLMFYNKIYCLDKEFRKQIEILEFY